MYTSVVKITLTLMVSLGVVYGEPPVSNQYGVPANLPVSNNHVSHGGVTNSYGAPLGADGHHDEHQDYIDSQPKSYEFGYAVKDSATGNDFGRRESSDGETVRGEYRVQLPDGRVQIVTYTADWRTGFHADVRYEGEATFPDQYNSGYNNGYNHNNNNNNGYNNGYNNFNNYNNGYNYNQNQPQGFNYHQGDNYNTHSNQGNYNNYQFPSNSDYNYNNNPNSFAPRPTYGTPQFH